MLSSGAKAKTKNWKTRSRRGFALVLLCFQSAAAADRSHIFVRGWPRRPISLHTKVRSNTSGQTRWARQLTGQTGAATVIFRVDARVRQVSVGDGHESSANQCRAPWVADQQEAPPGGQLHRCGHAERKGPSAAGMDANAARDSCRALCQDVSTWAPPNSNQVARCSCGRPTESP